MNDPESEFLEYQVAMSHELPAYFDEDDESMSIDHIWHQIPKQTDLDAGELCFKYLIELTSFLHLILQSKPCCESIFITIRKICTVVVIT